MPPAGIASTTTPVARSSPATNRPLLIQQSEIPALVPFFQRPLHRSLDARPPKRHKDRPAIHHRRRRPCLLEKLNPDQPLPFGPTLRLIQLPLDPFVSPRPLRNDAENQIRCG